MIRLWYRCVKLFLKIFIICSNCFWVAQMFAAPIPVVGVTKDSDGVALQMKPGVMRLEVYSPRIIRVTYAAQQKLPDLSSLAIIGKPKLTKWNWRQTNDEIILRTDEVQAHVNRATGAVSFFDKSGAPILAENPQGGKSLTPARINGINTLRSQDEFVLAPGEAIYGLGQHQNGLMNYRGTAIHLQQRNPTQSAV
ncbi:MAG TPA: hypothetical protein VKA67_03875, partial [Verrucomicrobiae bacterium]|nr:hypothetical protein [Verrucomicrobiae bacterium]